MTKTKEQKKPTQDTQTLAVQSLGFSSILSIKKILNKYYKTYI